MAGPHPGGVGWIPQSYPVLDTTENRPNPPPYRWVKQLLRARQRAPQLKSDSRASSNVGQTAHWPPAALFHVTVTPPAPSRPLPPHIRQRTNGPARLPDDSCPSLAPAASLSLDARSHGVQTPPPAHVEHPRGQVAGVYLLRSVRPSGPTLALAGFAVDSSTAAHGRGIAFRRSGRSNRPRSAPQRSGPGGAAERKRQPPTLAPAGFAAMNCLQRFAPLRRNPNAC